MADDSGDSATRKRKLPAFVAGGRWMVPRSRRRLEDNSGGGSGSKRRATEAAVRRPVAVSPTPSPSPPVPAAAAASASASEAPTTSPASIPNLHSVASRSPEPLCSASPPALVPLYATAAASSSRFGASLSPQPHVPAGAAASPPVMGLHFTGSSAASSSSAAPPASLPRAFDPAAAARTFPLLQMPNDVLSLLSAFMTPWDAFFLRCSCSTLRLVSGLNGGTAEPPQLARKEADTPKRPSRADRKLTVSASSAAVSETAPSQAAEGEEPAEWSDPHRFWHAYNSLDFRQILCGWREFEQQRARLLRERSNIGTRDGSPIPIDSPSSASPVANTITLFDSDEDEAQPLPLAQRNSDSDIEMESDGVQLRHARAGSLSFASASAASSISSSSAAARAPSPPAPHQWQIDIYDRLQRSVAHFALGFPRIRPSALCSSAASSRGGPAEDHATSSEDDVWLLSFLKSHRFPAISHLHFAYATLHSPLLHHLQAFCCAPPVESADGESAPGTVREVSVQFSEKSIGRWMDSVLTGFGPLHTVSLDLTSCQKVIWRPTILPLLPSLKASLTNLQLVGPTIAAASLPANILDTLSSALPELRVLLVAHGLATAQLHLVQACSRIRAERRWPNLTSLSLVHFPLVEHLLPLVDAFAAHGSLTTLDVQNSINLRLPVIELPKKQTAAAASSAKGKRAAVRADSPPPARAAPKQSADIVLPHTAVPSIPALATCTLSQCASLTVPSLRSLSLLFPRLHTLRLEGYESNLMGGTALKLLMDATSFPSLTTLHLSHCPQLDDHAWEALPKKTRMSRLRLLDLSVARSAASTGPTFERGKMGVGGRVVHSSAASAVKKKLTDQGLNMLLVYCPALSTLNLSGHVHLSPSGLLRVFTRLPCIERVSLAHMPLDASWLQSLVHLPIAHAFSVRISLSLVLLHTAPTLLPSLTALIPSQLAATASLPTSAEAAAAPDAAAAASSAAPSSPSPPLRRPSKLTSTSVNGSILRTKLAQQLQLHVAALTQRRVTLTVQL